MRRKLLALFWGLIASSIFANCYTVYDRNDRMILRSNNPPVNLSQPLREQVHRRWPGGSLIVTPDSASCYEVVEPPPLRTTASASNLRDVLDAMDERGAGDYASGVGVGGTSGAIQAGKDVNVRSYTRRDGTVVQAHTRSAPGSRSGGRGR